MRTSDEILHEYARLKGRLLSCDDRDLFLVRAQVRILAWVLAANNKGGE